MNRFHSVECGLNRCHCMLGLLFTVVAIPLQEMLHSLKTTGGKKTTLTCCNIAFLPCLSHKFQLNAQNIGHGTYSIYFYHLFSLNKCYLKWYVASCSKKEGKEICFSGAVDGRTFVAKAERLLICWCVWSDPIDVPLPGVFVVVLSKLSSGLAVMSLRPSTASSSCFPISCNEC